MTPSQSIPPLIPNGPCDPRPNNRAGGHIFESKFDFFINRDGPRLRLLFQPSGSKLIIQPSTLQDPGLRIRPGLRGANIISAKEAAHFWDVRLGPARWPILRQLLCHSVIWSFGYSGAQRGRLAPAPRRSHLQRFPRSGPGGPLPGSPSAEDWSPQRNNRPRG